MICPQCRKQLPDNAEACSYCGTRIDHKTQVVHEIKHRRYQRWIAYVLISVVVLGAIFFMVSIYSANVEMIQNINDMQAQLADAQKEIESKNSELNVVKKNLAGKEDEVKKYLQDLDDLKKQTDEFKGVLDENTELTEQVEEYELNLDAANANIYNLIITLGTGASNEDLNKIQLADANMVGVDTDEDGLPDAIEIAVGTDVNNPNSDGDTYNDKDEILAGYNPIGSGALPIDSNFSKRQVGKILLQVESEGEAWYVGSDGLKYFLGKPADAFRVMRDLEYWSSKKE